MLKTTCVLRQGMTYSKFAFVACGAPLWSLNITHLFHFPVCALLTQAHERPAGGGAQVRHGLMRCWTERTHSQQARAAQDA